jgi:hypothetical protein
MALRPGMYVIPAPIRPVMVFVHKDDQELAAGFQQNALQRVRAGDEAEIAFDGLPGRILKGKVKYVLHAIATGQFQATGVLQDLGADVPSPSSTLRTTHPATTFQAARRLRWRSTRLMRITSPSSAASSCGCEAGRITSF